MVLPEAKFGFGNTTPGQSFNPPAPTPPKPQPQSRYDEEPTQSSVDDPRSYPENVDPYVRHRRHRREVVEETREITTDKNAYPVSDTRTVVTYEGTEPEIRQQKQLRDLQRRGYSTDGIYFNQQGQGMSIAPAIVDRQQYMPQFAGTTFIDSGGNYFSANPDTVATNIAPKSSFALADVTYASGRQETVDTGTIDVYGTPFYADNEMFKKPPSPLKKAWSDTNSGVRDFLFPMTPGINERALNPGNELDLLYTNAIRDENRRNTRAVMDLDSNTYSMKTDKVFTFFDVPVVGGVARGAKDYVIENPLEIAGLYGGAFVAGKVVSSVPPLLNFLGSKPVGYTLTTLYAGGVGLEIARNPKNYQNVLGRELINFPVFLGGFSAGVKSGSLKYPDISFVESNTKLKRFSPQAWAKQLVAEGKVKSVNFVKQSDMPTYPMSDARGVYYPRTKEIFIVKGLKQTTKVISPEQIALYKNLYADSAFGDIGALKGMKYKTGTKSTLAHELIHAEGGREFEAFLFQGKGRNIFVDPKITKPTYSLDVKWKPINQLSIFTPKIARIEAMRAMSESLVYDKNIGYFQDGKFIVASEQSISKGGGFYSIGKKYFKLSYTDVGKGTNINTNFRKLFSEGKISIQEFKYLNSPSTVARREGFIKSARELFGQKYTPSTSDGVLRAVTGRPRSVDVIGSGSSTSADGKSYINFFSKFSNSKNTFYRLTSGRVTVKDDSYRFLGESVDTTARNIIPGSQSIISSRGNLFARTPEKDIFGYPFERVAYKDINVAISKSSLKAPIIEDIASIRSSFGKRSFISSSNGLLSTVGTKSTTSVISSSLLYGNVPPARLMYNVESPQKLFASVPLSTQKITTVSRTSLSTATIPRYASIVRSDSSSILRSANLPSVDYFYDIFSRTTPQVVNKSGSTYKNVPVVDIVPVQKVTPAQDIITRQISRQTYIPRTPRISRGIFTAPPIILPKFFGMSFGTFGGKGGLFSKRTVGRKNLKSSVYVLPDLWSVNITESATGKEAIAPLLTKKIRWQAEGVFKGLGGNIIYTEQMRKGLVKF